VLGFSDGADDAPVPAEVPEGVGAGAEAGLEAGAEVSAVPRFNRGRSSLLLDPLLAVLSIPTGTSSAFRVVFGASVPLGRNEPAPTHGCGAPCVLLCNAPLIVNSPKESPACSAS
jgi:hypothetical protein